MRVLTNSVGLFFVIIFVITRTFAGAKKALQTQIFELWTLKESEQKAVYYRQISRKIDIFRHEIKKIVMTKMTRISVERCGSGHFALKSS